MNDVWPLFAKRWYGHEDHDYFWQLFAVYESKEKAEASKQRLEEPRRHGRIPRDHEFSKNRKREFSIQRNMVL